MATLPRFVRSRAFQLTAASALSATAYYQYTLKKPVLQLDEKLDLTTANEKGVHLWTPPSREDLLSALKKSQVLPAEKSDVESAKAYGIATSKPDTDESGYDLLIIGGGATGAGVALDAASRGLRVALVERDDFASGTSSKSTKLVHGGVRYLQKAVMELDYEQWKLVKEALHERKTFLHIAPHLSHHLPLMLPVYTWWKLPYYWVGCKMYDFLAGAENMESSYLMSKGKSIQEFPMLKSDGLVGSLVYYDGQHNDSRMNISLIMTAVHHGAVCLNHTEVTALQKGADGRITGVSVKDKLTGEDFNVKAKGVINATGPFTDGIRKLDDPTVKEIVAPSSGVHITLPKYFAPGHMGLLDPATSDGRVIFFLPWQGNSIAGTTDTQVSEVPQNPLPQEEEIQWILGEIRNYLSPDIKVRRGDVLSAWSGIRPLVRNPHAKNTEALVRNHLISIDPKTGLLTIAGGKWTTYRAMAAETVDAAIKEFHLEDRVKNPCLTEHLRLLGAHGWHKNLFVSLIQQFGLDTDVAKHLSENYGSLAWVVCSMAAPTGERWPVHGIRLDPNYPYIEAEVTYAVQRELAARATDVIGRRTRLAFLNAQAALEVLPTVIDIMSKQLGWDSQRCNAEFDDAKDYLKSFGLEEELLKLSFSEVRNGAAKRVSSNQQNSRAIFDPEELQTLQETFAILDKDKDGSISASDLEYAMKRVGYPDVSKAKVNSVLKSLATRQGRIEFPEFLNAATGFKELELSNAFTRVVQDVQAAELKGKVTDAGVRTRIPVERSGGGA